MNSSLSSRLRFTLKIQSALRIGNRCAYNIVLVIQWKQRRIYDCVTNTIALPTKRFNYYFRLCKVMRNFVYEICLTYQSFAYLCMVHGCMAWCLCLIQNIVPHHMTEEDWCKCGSALALQLRKSHYTLPSLHRRSIPRPLQINKW